MIASVVTRQRSCVRAPPPTPIKTTKGNRSAAFDDRVLGEFLDTSIRLPDLNLPRSHFLSPHAPSPIADEIDVSSLDQGDIVAERRVLSAMRDTGAFRITASSLSVEVKLAIDAGKLAFGIDDHRKEKILAKWFRRRDVVEEEFYWNRPVTSEMDQALQSSFPNSTSYQTFKSKMESIATKLETISSSITKTLHSKANYPTNPARLTKKPPSVLCITQFSVNQSNLTWNELGDAEQPSNYDLCLHISPQDQDFRVCSFDGSGFYNIPSGSSLITAGKQLQDWSNGEYKSAIGEVLYELSEDPNPYYSIEFFYGTEDNTGTGVREVPSDSLSIKHQLFILAFIFIFVNFISTWFGYKFY